MITKPTGKYRVIRCQDSDDNPYYKAKIQHRFFGILNIWIMWDAGDYGSVTFKSEDAAHSECRRIIKYWSEGNTKTVVSESNVWEDNS